MTVEHISLPKIVTRKEWLVKRKDLLRQEKQLTRARDELLAAVKETLTEPHEIIPHRFITEGDFVVVEHTGKN